MGDLFVRPFILADAGSAWRAILTLTVGIVISTLSPGLDQSTLLLGRPAMVWGHASQDPWTDPAAVVEGRPQPELPEPDDQREPLVRQPLPSLNQVGLGPAAGTDVGSSAVVQHDSGFRVSPVVERDWRYGRSGWFRLSEETQIPQLDPNWVQRVPPLLWAAILWIAATWLLVWAA
jgi:hypothetical protein